LPQIYHTFADEEYLYLVMEYIPKGTLSEMLFVFSNSGFSRPVVQFYAA
jgi:serine/threonine protein kinase